MVVPSIGHHILEGYKLGREKREAIADLIDTIIEQTKEDYEEAYEQLKEAYEMLAEELKSEELAHAITEKHLAELEAKATRVEKEQSILYKKLGKSVALVLIGAWFYYLGNLSYQELYSGETPPYMFNVMLSALLGVLYLVIGYIICLAVTGWYEWLTNGKED